VVSFKPRPLLIGERSPRYELDRRLVEVGTGLDAVARRNISLPLPGIEPLL
jgi:hypothetical protein